MKQPMYRRCQECGFVQKDYDFDELKSEKARDAFDERACGRCKSPALDRGTRMERRTRE